MSIQRTRTVASALGERSLGALVLAALALAACWPALHGGFLFDDKAFLLHNPLVLADDGLVRLWTTTEPMDFWPLSYSVLWVEWRLFGPATFGYHLVDLALHVGVAFLLWRLLVALRALPERPALLAAALFCVHPVNVEAAAWIFQTKTTLAALLAAGAALAFVSERDRLALLLFTLAILAKTSVVTLPLAGVAYAWCETQSGRRSRVLRRCLPGYAVAALLGGVALWFRTLHATVSDAGRMDGPLSRLCGAARALWFYAGKDLLPTRLAFIYPKWDLGATSWSQLLPLAAAIAVGVALWRRRATWLGRTTGVALWVFVVLLLPCLGFVDISFMRYAYVADHWQYPAIIAPLAWVIAVGGRWLAGLRSRLGARLMPYLVVPLLLTLTCLAYQRAAAFNDEDAFWTAALAANPRCLLAQVTLGTLADERGDADAAVRHYQAALALGDAADADPTLIAGAHYNYGAMLAEHGRKAEAVSHYRAALGALSQVPLLHQNLGGLLLDLGDPAGAAAELTAAATLIEADGRYGEARRVAEQAQALALRYGLAEQAAAVSPLVSRLRARSP